MSLRQRLTLWRHPALCCPAIEQQNPAFAFFLLGQNVDGTGVRSFRHGRDQDQQSDCERLISDHYSAPVVMVRPVLLLQHHCPEVGWALPTKSQVIVVGDVHLRKLML